MAYFNSPKSRFSEERNRRSEITNLAFSALGGRDAALSFLNSHNAVLGARPIDLATDSAEGWASVATLIRAM